MRRPSVLALAVAAAVLELLPFALAHGDEHGEAMGMSAHATSPPQAHEDGLPQSYWSLSEHATLMYWHVGLEILAWIIVLPVGKYQRNVAYNHANSVKLSCLALRALVLLLSHSWSS